MHDPIVDLFDIKVTKEICLFDKILYKDSYSEGFNHKILILRFSEKWSNTTIHNPQLLHYLTYNFFFNSIFN